jgi:hexosaminidase
MNRWLLLLLLLPLQSFAQLLPWPHRISPGAGFFVANQLITQAPSQPQLLAKLAELPFVSIRHSNNKAANLQLQLKQTLPELPTFQLDESYEILISPNGIKILADNQYGARHALVTLEQLWQQHQGKLPVQQIRDRPRFPWRGLLVDVVRRWISLPTLKRQLDIMAQVKMNVLHLHLSDDQGFRMESKRYPRLHQLNHDGHYFTQLQMQELIEYAALRGIRVVPEFDVPGHATSILAAYPHLSSSAEVGSAPSKKYGPQDPALNPAHEETYLFLEQLFKEMAGLFPDAYFHVGGDEVSGKHWMANAQIRQFMQKHKLKDVVEMQFYFTRRVEKIVTGLGKKMVAWDEVLKEQGELNSVAQIWRGPKHGLIALNKKMPVLFSYGYYLDLQQPSSTHYLVDPALEMGLKQDPELLWGGEACMWTERVSDELLTERIWPRAMAVAERLWSAAEVRDVQNFYQRQEQLAQRLKLIPRLLPEHIAAHSKSWQVKSSDLLGFLAWLGPAHFYAQHRYREHHLDTPLQQVVDFMPSESISATILGWKLQQWLNSPNAVLELELIKSFQLWQSFLPQLAGMKNSLHPEGSALLELAKDLGLLGGIAQECLHLLKSGDYPGYQWAQEQQNKIYMFSQVRAGLRPAVLPLVARMVELVRQKHQLDDFSGVVAR